MKKASNPPPSFPKPPPPPPPPLKKEGELSPCADISGFMHALVALYNNVESVQFTSEIDAINAITLCALLGDKIKASVRKIPTP